MAIALPVLPRAKLHNTRYVFAWSTVIGISREEPAILDRQRAESFAADWIAAWNRHDLDAILSHYTDDVVFRSPRIALVLGEEIDFVAGKPALARYWGRALAQSQDLHFTLDRLYVGSDSLAIAYRNHRDQHVTETFVFGAAGLVKEAIAAYA
jgi:hypothetical protein